MSLSTDIISMKIHLWDTIYSENDISPLGRIETTILPIQKTTPTF